ncbi:MAG: hypothetical protein ACJ77F_13480 [Chloroflexota bacterium]
MGFEVPVRAVSRSRRPRGVLATMAAFALVVSGAAVSGLGATGLPSVARVASPGVATPFPSRLTAERGPTLRFEPASFNRPLPTSMECHSVAPTQCRRLVRAALRILPDELPDVRTAAVWESLVCNDNFDCPPDHLRDAEPAGSVVLGFVDRSESVAVNVVDWGYGTSVRLGLRAWLARSVPTE